MKATRSRNDAASRFDEKRLHYFHRMYHAGRGFLSATTEIMAVHVDLDERKVVPGRPYSG